MKALSEDEWTAEAIASGWDPRILGSAWPTGRNDCRRPLAQLLEATGGDVLKVAPDFIGIGEQLPGRVVYSKFYSPDVQQSWRKAVS